LQLMMACLKMRSFLFYFLWCFLEQNEQFFTVLQRYFINILLRMCNRNNFIEFVEIKVLATHFGDWIPVDPSFAIHS
jgi:hypothetical protein